MTVRIKSDTSHSLEGIETDGQHLEVPQFKKLPVQKALEIQPVSELSLKKKNVVLLNELDFIQIFGEVSLDSPKYLQIAGQIFRVALAVIDQGRIGMADFQMDSVAEEIYSTTNYRGISASPYEISEHIPFAIGKLEVEIDDEATPFSKDHQCIISLSDVQHHLKKMLKNEVITRNKTLILTLPQGTFKITIRAIHPAEETIVSDTAFGTLQRDTELAIIPKLPPHVIITDHIYREEVERMDFQLSVTKRSQFASHSMFPVCISQEEIMMEIRNRFKNRVVAKEAEFTIHHSNGWDITVKFSEGILAEDGKSKRELPLFDYTPGFILSEETPIRLKKSSSILLSEGEPKLAEKITFKIFDLPGVQKVDIDHEKELWIALEELKQAILKLDRPFAVGEMFEVSLSSGSFYIETIKAQSLEGTGELKRKTTEPLWLVKKETDIQIATEKELNLNVLKDHSIHPIKRASIQIKSEKIPEKGLQITFDQLKKLALTQAPKRLVENHIFSVITEDRDRLEFKVLRTMFGESVEKTDEVSVFGVLKENSEIDFSTSPSEKLTVVEQVHSENLKAMRFSMRAFKQSDLGKHDNPPIIINRMELTRLIREELAKHPYITEGFSKSFSFDNGWDIEVTFLKGLLKKSGPHAQSSRSLKEGYAIQEETEVLLEGGAQLIALTQGSPISAARVHLEIISIKEDFTTEDTSLEKGSWINVEELKRELLEKGRPLVIGEKIFVHLKTGQYIVKVKSAKPKDRKAKLPKKRRETIWQLSEETKVSAMVDSSLDLTPIDNGKIYPLEKIKFIVFPKKSGEHISIKEGEIKKALMEVLPDQLIRGQILKLETKNNHTLFVQIEEVKLKNEVSSINKEKIFTAITPETEILFRGKEKTSIAIRSEPKVLEVEDPIAYLEDLGMAGIDKEFEQAFRIFYSRSDRLIEEARRRGTKPIKGILFYGPPGTGKTTLARHVGDMLGCSGERLQLITATEMFNMWFGKSEENIRKLFEPAREAQKKYGNKSPLYIVIIDEIDALLPQRGGSVNKVRDSLVNQFLGEIDGLNELNNLLVIGLTNRKNEIDPAALRHGRLGVHIEIGLPTKTARRKIFEVHTRKLEKEGLLHESVNLDVLAEKTDKLPGAAIEGIVESASLFSLARLSKLKCPKEELSTHPEGMVTMEDFEKALKEQTQEKEIPESIRHLYI